MSIALPSTRPADTAWTDDLVNAVLGGELDENHRGRAAIRAILKVVADHCDSFGAALWRVRESNSALIAIMGSYFDGTEDWLIPINLELDKTTSGKAILSNSGCHTTNDLRKDGQLLGEHPFLKKHEIIRAQSVTVDIPEWNQGGALTIYRKVSQHLFDELESGDDLTKLRAVAAMVPGLFRAALHEAELTLRREVGEAIRKHEENESDGPGVRLTVRRKTIEHCCNALQKAFSCLEVSVFLAEPLDRNEDDPPHYKCFYTNEGPHTEQTWKRSYDSHSVGYSPLVFAIPEDAEPYIHVRDTPDVVERQEFIDHIKYGSVFKPHKPGDVMDAVIEQLKRHLPDPEKERAPLSLIVSRIESHGITLGFVRCWVALNHGPRSYQAEDAKLLNEISQPIARMVYDWRTADLLRKALTFFGKENRLPTPTRSRGDQYDFFVEALPEINAAIPNAGINTVSLKMPKSEELQIVACSGEISDAEWLKALNRRHSAKPGDEKTSLASEVFLTGESKSVRAVQDVENYRELFSDIREMVVVQISAGANSPLGVLELRNKSDKPFPPYTGLFAELFGRLLGPRYAWYLERREKLERESEFNRAFSDASHQMKGPLAAACKRLDPLLTENPRSVPTWELHPIRAMLRRTEFAARLVRLFGDIAAGRGLEISGRPVVALDWVKSISVLCQDAMSSADPADEIKVEFSHDSVYESVPAAGLKSERDLIEQALWNLIDNAVKYSFRKQTVRIFAGKTRKGRFYFGVTNRGATIAPHEVELCKQRHWRKPEIIPFVGDGNGLGLYIADEIMRAHGGSLDIIPTRSDGVTEVRLSFDLNLS